MAVMLMAKAFNIKVGNAGKKLVLLKLADNANDKGECWPSYQHIADQCEISKRSAMNYINSLIDDGLIRKQVRKGPKGNSTNVYVLSLGGENAAPHGANGSPPSERAAPPSERAAPPSERAAPGGSEPAAPGISHSFESVNESVTSASDESDLPSAEFVSLICKDGTEYKVDPGYLQEIIKLHPRVDVTAELQAMRAWLLSNPGKRKTGAGMKRFINSWLTRAAQTTDRPRGNVRDFQSYQGQSQPAPRPRKLFPGINHAPLPSRASTGGEA
jgi:hypothetical protein